VTLGRPGGLMSRGPNSQCEIRLPLTAPATRRRGPPHSPRPR
jgi:hypothetical protein